MKDLSDQNPPEAVVVMACQNATEFLSTLSPRNERWCLGPNPDWLYRGHADARWKLVPKALRADGWGTIQKEFTDKYLPLPNTADAQILAEYSVINYFVEAADRQGISLPEDSIRFREVFVKWSNENPVHSAFLTPRKWPSPELLPIMAAAQHHGVPTRLLDWSRRSYIAAYFAASEFAKRLWEYQLLTDRGCSIESDISEIAVWSLSTEYLHMQPVGVEVIKAPAGANPNLAAQKGIFTLVRETEKRGHPANTQGLEERLEADAFPPPLVKVTMPIRDVPKLLRFLSAEYVDAASMFPGLDGVAKRVFEQPLWDSYRMRQEKKQRD
ncbi:MAG: FRG domain-containing protein [Candidatus Alcyoniella australis]|nr:FRG domain-containing protein [Candidatus Alcyoniella australis]